MHLSRCLALLLLLVGTHVHLDAAPIPVVGRGDPARVIRPADRPARVGQVGSSQSVIQPAARPASIAQEAVTRAPQDAPATAAPTVVDADNRHLSMQQVNRYAFRSSHSMEPGLPARPAVEASEQPAEAE